ncbi:uncharacterized protein [Chlorocebus sabaeus]|uniref:uncharacterized protein n=1 Tax=Chlorocebus sabaeus TaxID=60711 RepID=UPI003BFA2107
MHQPDPRREQPEKRSPVPVPRTSRPAEPRPACELESKGSPQHAGLQRRLPGNRSPTLPQTRVPGTAEKEGPVGGGAGQDLPGGGGPAPPPTQAQLLQEPEAAPGKEKMPRRPRSLRAAPPRPAPPAQTHRPPQFPLVSASTSHAHGTPLTPPDGTRRGGASPKSLSGSSTAAA